MPLVAADVATSRMRHAGRDLLSLALIDARNRTLRWASVFESAFAAARRVSPSTGTESPLWLIGHVGWLQEHWIARNVQRQRGESCDPTAPRLASIAPEADSLYDPALVPPGHRWEIELPDLQQTRLYLADTMEVTLELLEGAEESDEGLYFFRMALLREDLAAEALARIAQTLGVSLGAAAKGLLPEVASTVPRPPLVFPAMRLRLGSERGGFAFDNERPAHEVAIPEFEIDSQPVSWAQYVEFVEDGGYDDDRWWSRAGWQWLRERERRVPRYVDQMRGAVLQHRFGQLVRVPTAQPAMHVAWHEAEAWVRWAGRRLPTEVEWEAAAVAGRSRGFRFGEVWEWTAGGFGPYPGFEAGPDLTYSLPAFGRARALRGASFAAPRRLVDPKFRTFKEAEGDDLFVGFRSCAT